MQCSKCHRDAIVFQPYSGLHLCSQHLIADVEAKAKKMIRAQGWLRPGDHIAVILSDDKKSYALLYFLKHLTRQRRDIQVSALIIREGTGSQSDTLRAKHFAECLDTELREIAWPEESRIGTRTGTRREPDMSSPPLFPISRPLLPDTIAQQHGITKIAWGLCLDEAAAVVLGNIIRGDGEKLVRSIPDPEVLPRICPFISVTAAEVSLYAAHCGLSEEPAPSPEQGDPLHKDTVAILDAYTNNHPATKYALLNLGENLAGPHTGIPGLIHACEEYRVYRQGYYHNNAQSNEVKDDTY